jgi:hypothetical protein
MKRIGSIYLRDLFKSKEKAEKKPLEEITLNNSLVKGPQPQHNHVNFNYASKNLEHLNSSG